MKKLLTIVAMLALCASVTACGSDDKKDEPTPDVTADDTAGDDAVVDEDVTIPEEDVTIPEEDVTIPEEDVTIPEEDVTIPEEDVTIPEEDLTVEEDIVVEPVVDGCVNEADGAIILEKGDEISAFAKECGMACLAEDDIVACATPCVEEKTGLSADCSSCYVGIILCTINACAAQCIADPDAPECLACQVENGCYAAFYGCSGLTPPPAVDQCTNEADGAIILEKSDEISAFAKECGMACLAEDDVVVCATPCVEEKTGLSAGCASCYVGMITCTILNCAAECIADPDAPECTDCQVDKGCYPDFYECSGLTPSE